MARNSDELDQLTPEEASRIIHSHRKVRYGTACWPCRQRKVKCTNTLPCENCVKREHPQLCSYKPNRSSASMPSQQVYDRKRALSASDGDEGRKAERQDSWPRTMANLDDSESVGDRYLGQNSIPALLRDQSSPNDKSDNVDIRRDMRSILGLDTSAPFPLMSSMHLHRLARDIAEELPSDREVIKLFRTYKEIPHPFWGFVYDMDDLESKMMAYLEDRSRNASGAFRSSRPVTASWLAILFAVLAVGSQYHENPYHKRTSDSQKYIQISFHYLRLGNFLLKPSFDSIQALLLTSFVLLNDMKAEASWALTGLTCRLAQSLGLHRHNTYDGREGVPPEEMIRRKLWWTCVWHDTLTSLSFDRIPITNFPCCPIPETSSAGGYTYLEMMYHLIEIISRRLNPDATATSSYEKIADDIEAVETLRRKARAHMKDKEECHTAEEKLQYYAIRLHTSFVITVACRPALRRDCELDPGLKHELADRCKDNLLETVRMFLDMNKMSVIPTRTWAFTYHGLSSIILLTGLCETKADPEIRQLQGDLIAALSATAAKDATSPEPHLSKTDKDIELSGPLWRALTALKNIYNHGSIMGSGLKREDSSAGASGSRTPLPPPSGNPREDAALAMAQMQNGASLSDFSGIPFTQPMPTSVGLDGMPGLNMDQAQYMAPMDLYDSIWGGKSTAIDVLAALADNPDSSDPWDSIRFDFSGQPPQQPFYF